MSKRISVIIPAYNSDPRRLGLTLEALRRQSLSFSDWELIIIDNNSFPALQPDVSWHPHHQLIKEPLPGLTNARLAGFAVAEGDVLVMVDDDNVLDYQYLFNVLEIFAAHPNVGAAGGKSVPVFEKQPPPWIGDFYGNLALRDLGNDPLLAVWEHHYPHFAPIGAGMALKRDALAAYMDRARSGEIRISDRTGSQLTSGGDNDLVLEILQSGWQVGYFPALRLQHLIPESRMSAAYLGRLNKDTSRSWVAVLEKHQINPWKSISAWSVPFRKIKAWLSFRAWKDQASYVRWKGTCGMFEGLAEIKR